MVRFNEVTVTYSERRGSKVKGHGIPLYPTRAGGGLYLRTELITGKSPIDTKPQI